jgi:hypothetical protein
LPNYALMKLVDSIDRAALDDARLVAESNEFAIYDVGNDSYTLVHRHEGVKWQGVTISGDAIFRIAELLAIATRSLYRDVAGDLSRHRARP